jgi:hypothetical protein
MVVVVEICAVVPMAVALEVLEKQAFAVEVYRDLLSLGSPPL